MTQRGVTQSSLPANVTAILGGVHVLICRPEEPAQALAKALSAMGASCYTFPTLEIEELAISDLERQYILSLDQYDYVIVTSQHAAKAGLELIDNYWPQLPIKQTWLAIGQKTASLLAAENIKLISPKNDLTSEDLLKLAPLQKIKHQKTLLLKGQGGREIISEVLRKRGAAVDEVNVYQRIRPNYSENKIQAALVDFPSNYIAALSGETLLNLISLCEAHHINLSSKTLIVPSHRVANIAYEHGFKSVLIPANLKPIDLIKCIRNHKNNIDL